jgi:hypothetical protein
MRIDDYRTFWPEEEAPPPTPRRSPPAPRRSPRRIRRIAVVRDIGLHVALYWLLGAGLGATLTIGGLGLLWLLGLLFGG